MGRKGRWVSDEKRYDLTRRSGAAGRRGRWMFLLKDNAILLLPAGFAVATLFVGAVPLMAEMVGGMSERMVSRVGVLLEGMAGALLAFGIGVAVITLMRQEVHHREMMDDKILTPTDVNIRIDQVPEGREDG